MKIIKSKKKTNISNKIRKNHCEIQAGPSAGDAGNATGCADSAGGLT